MKAILILVLSCLIGACQTAEHSTCVEQDWYEIGRKSGAMGEPAHNLEAEFASCKESSKAQATSLYENGRNAGLSLYCQPSNAYELGKLNQPYHKVCPTGLESEFQEAYGKGMKIFNLKIESTRLEIEVDNLQRIRKQQPQKTSLLKELIEVEKQLLQNEKEIKKLTELENSIRM